MISSGKGSFQRSHRTFRRLRQRRTTASEQHSQVEVDVMENVVMNAVGSLHQKPREKDAMDVEASLHQKPRENDAMDVEESLTRTSLKILRLSTSFENTKLNRVKNGTRCLLQVGVRDWESLGASPSMIQKGFCGTVADVMDAEASRLRSSPRIMIPT